MLWIWRSEIVILDFSWLYPAHLYFSAHSTLITLAFEEFVLSVILPTYAHTQGARQALRNWLMTIHLLYIRVYFKRCWMGRNVSFLPANDIECDWSTMQRKAVLCQWLYSVILYFTSIIQIFCKLLKRCSIYNQSHFFFFFALSNNCTWSEVGGSWESNIVY